jgi:hydrogenase expression/formation protein HypD
VVLAAFGDMMRVPGAHGSPLQRKARGLDVRIVYSPLDALAVARANPAKRVIFFAIGFETTAPSTALTIMRARAAGVRNFFVFSNHVAIMPAIRAILDSPDSRLDGFIGPGHVSTIIGCDPYEWIAREARTPFVIAGFEPLDLLQAIAALLGQLAEGAPRVQNRYGRVVARGGNPTALAAMAEVFEPRPSFEWRGLGSIAQSGLRIRERYAAWDAEREFGQVSSAAQTPASAGPDEHAECGSVLRGMLKPAECRWFGTACTPERPIGALMVSSEGSCAAYYLHRHALVESGAADRRFSRT